MKTLAMTLAATVISTAALAGSTTVIHRDGADDTAVVHSGTVVKKKVMTTGSVGCKSKTVRKTDEFGDTKVKHKVKC